MINRIAIFLVVLLTIISVGDSADQYFHVAAHNPGFNDTMWLTDAQVFNPDAVNSIEVSLSFLASGENNTGADEVTITVGPRQAALLEDLVASVLDRAEAGSIRLTSDALFFASSRTFNIGDGESGTYGQYIAAASSDTAILQGILLLANNDPEDDGFRTNAGFVNPGTQNVSIEVSVFNTDLGVLIGSTSLNLPSLGFQQLNNVFQIVGQHGSTWSNATIQFLATAPVLAYASVVDNTSGDAIFVTPSADTGTPPDPNNPPAGTIDEPTADLTIAPGESVFFSGSASDPDGDDVTVLWDFGDGMTSTELEPGDHTFADPGEYVVSLTATDDQGLADPTPATRTITVQGANTPPNATINEPSVDVTIAAGESVFFSGSAADPDGDELTVLWAFGDGMTSTNLNPGNHTYSDAGTFTVTLTATDDHGLADPTPATRTITVTAAAPTLTQIQDQIFSPSCDSCHGGGSPEADLNLEQGQSYSNLVNVPATTQSGTRVIPSNPDNSVLVTYLEGGHRSLSGAQIQLIRDWITSGAPNN